MKRPIKPLSRSSVFVASHELFSDGSVQALEKYLAPRTERLEVWLYPFKGAPEERVAVHRYQQGESTKNKRFRWSAPMPNNAIAWLRDLVLLTARLVWVGRKIDVFVGIDPLNCVAGVLLRRIGLLRSSVVYYTIDYVPQRFANQRLNRFYHGIDEYCCRHADVVWNVSPEIEVARAERSGVGGRALEIVVPIGIHDVASAQTEPPQRLVFLGHLLEKQGLQYVIPALPEIARAFPSAQMDIIGTGPFEETLKGLAKEHDVSNRVTFHGYIENPNEVVELLTQGGIGIAVYDPDPNSFTRFADPGKLKAYLAAGLPILLSDVPAAAHNLVAQNCAVMVDAEPSAVAAGAISMLSNQQQLQRQSEAAVGVAANYLWTNVFDQAWRNSDQVIDLTDSSNNSTLASL